MGNNTFANSFKALSLAVTVYFFIKGHLPQEVEEQKLELLQ